jgi:hypothetical protein
MAKLVPSWLPAPRHVAVNDVNSRYLLYTTLIFAVTIALFKKHFFLDLADRCLIDLSIRLTRADRAALRVNACDLPDRHDALVEEFKDFVG